MGACEPPEVFHHFLYVCSWVSVLPEEGALLAPPRVQNLSTARRLCGISKGYTAVWKFMVYQKQSR